MIFQSGELVINKYRVISFLGTTDLEEVYRVVRNDHKVERLLKVLSFKTTGMGNSKITNTRQRFKLESQLSSQINSPTPNPNILQVYETTETDELCLLEMEYASGGSLSERIQLYKSKSLRFEKVNTLKIATEISNGLARLHDLDIIHRNLIPTNIVFDQYDTTKITGLGLAQISSSPSLRSPFTNPIEHPGTPGYMSPEQRNSADRLSPSSDVYALGLILFEMLTGNSYSNYHPRTRLSDLMPGIKPSLNELVSRMLSEFPNDRPCDGRETANELHREFLVEEMAQREIQAKKQRELEEWEKLKQEELTREKEPRQVVKAHLKSESEVQPSKETEKTRPREDESTGKPETEMATNLHIKKEKVEFSIDDGGIRITTPIETHQPQMALKKIFRKTWWLVLPIIIAIIIILSIPAKVPETLPTKQPAAILVPTRENTSTVKTIATQTAISTPEEEDETPVVQITEAIQEITLVPALTLTIAENNSVDLTPAPTVSENVMRNPSFENDEAWELKVGDYHIQGQYSITWASKGARSYQISLGGDKKFDYCFTPGMRTSINQKIDLTNVNEILFDMKIRPAAYSGTSHGDNSKHRMVAFVDGEQVFTSPEGYSGEKLNQRITLNGKYSGMHDLKLGLMVMSRSCVRSENEPETFMLNLDNVRLLYK